MVDGSAHERYEVPDEYPEDGGQEVYCEEADDKLFRNVGDGFGSGVGCIGDGCGLICGRSGRRCDWMMECGVCLL